jgi:hypothetical protein
MKNEAHEVGGARVGAGSEWHTQVQGRVALAIGRRVIGWTDPLVGWSSCIYIIQTRDRILANKRVTSAHQ